MKEGQEVFEDIVERANKHLRALPGNEDADIRNLKGVTALAKAIAEILGSEIP